MVYALHTGDPGSIPGQGNPSDSWDLPKLHGILISSSLIPQVGQKMKKQAPGLLKHPLSPPYTQLFVLNVFKSDWGCGSVVVCRSQSSVRTQVHSLATREKNNNNKKNFLKIITNYLRKQVNQSKRLKIYNQSHDNTITFTFREE